MNKKILVSMFLCMTVGFSANVNVTTKYGRTGGIVGPINTTTDKVNGREICPNDPTAGCDFSDDPQFNNHNTVDNPTDDSYNGDLLVRTNDNFQAIAGWTWNGTAGGAEEVATITGTLPETNGEHYYEWTQLPGSCNPANSSILADKQTIVCERKDFDKNNAGTFSEDVTFNVRVLGGTPSGTQPGDITFKVEAPNATAKEDTTDGYSLTVTAAPRWNLEKSMYTTYAGKTDPDDPNVKGWIMDYKFYIESDEVTRNGGEIDTANPIVGNESMGEDTTFEFTDDMSGLPPHAKVIGCSMNGRYGQQDGYDGSSDPLTCFGSGCIHGSNYPERHILAAKDEQVITCTQNGNQVAVKVEHVNGTLDHYPTKDYYGRDLPVNRAIAAIGNIYIFVPLSDVKNGEDDQNGTADDGEYTTNNKLTGFDPTTPTGHSNFAGETESEKDNSYGRTLYYSAGSWDKYYRGTHHGLNDSHGVWAYVGSGYRSGDGMATKGLEFSTALDSTNSGGTSFTEDTYCDVIDAYRMKIQAVQDNTVYNEIKTTYVGRPEWPFRYYIRGGEGNYTESNDPALMPYIVEYATDYVDNSFLPSQGGDTSADVSQIIKTECTDANVNWSTDFDAVKDANNGLGVTKVRFRLKPGVEKNSGAYNYIFLNHKVRGTDLASNQPMQNNDLIVNYAAHKFSGQEWSLPSYKPGTFPGNHSGGAGDRVIYTGPKVRIKKHESRSAASPGDEVTYTLESSYTDDIGSEGNSGQVTITDILPKDFKYQQGSISPSNEFGEPTIGTCADAADITSAASPCVDGENQVLIWDLGIRPVNAPQMPDLNYTALIGAAANVGVNTNVAKIESPTDASPLSQRKADIGLTIDIPASINIVKSTEENSDYPSKRERTTDPKDIFFLMDMRNGKSGDITDLDVIDILPFIGDGDDEAIKFNDLKLKRAEPTAYHGTMVFHEASFGENPGSSTACDYSGKLDYYYTNADPKTINMAPTVGDANDVNNASSIWCQGDENGPNGCTIDSSGFTFTDNSEVTAVRARGPRMEEQAICQFKVHVTVDDNLMGDNYSNSAGASATGITLPVLSNSLAVPIVGSSLGDLVWYDKNKDGVQDPGENGIAGVKVHLLDGSGNPVNDPTTGQPYIVTTDADGKYSFEKLNHGEYQVRFEPLEGYAVSPKESGGNSATDSDVNTDSNITDTITLGVDEDNPTIDMGLFTPIISGHIFNDGDGDANVNGSAIAKPDGTQLYATLLDENGNVLATTPIADDGTYQFDGDDGVRANKNYKVVLSTSQNATTSTLPANWNNTGQKEKNAANGNDGSNDGIVEVHVSTVDVPNNDFGINKRPVAEDVENPVIQNPRGTTTVAAPELNVTDNEDGTPTTITIKTLPDNAKLYYDGVLVTAGQKIENFDQSKLTIDPDDGDQDVEFTYTTTDADGQESDPATVKTHYKEPVLSGTIYDDGNGDGNVNGTEISAPDGTQLYATLVDRDTGKVLASKALNADGTYSFNGSDGLAFDGKYDVVLGTVEANAGDDAPTADLPADWNNTGEKPASDKTNGNDGDKNGLLSVDFGPVTGPSAMPNNDFGINKKPVATDVTDPVVQNPGKDTQVEAPELNVTDNEDGTPTTITIETLPDAATGVLYYNGTAVTAGQVIPHFDQSKLTIDPTDGDQTVTFTYSTTDADGVKSDPATAEASFIDPILSGKVHNDGNGNGNVDSDAISAPDGTQLYATLLDENGAVLATQAIKADGTYSFNATDGVSFDKTFSVVIADKENVTETSLPTNWNNTGEQPANTESNGNDGDKNGKLEVSFGPITGDKEMPNNDFGINKKPVAEDITDPVKLNPGGDIQMAVPDLNVTDNEDGTPTTITIKTLPTNGTLYYDGTPVTAGQVIPNFDQSKLTVDPNNGEVTVTFDYSTTDADGVESDSATVTMPFKEVKILGNVFNDGDGDENVNGTAIPTPDGVQLYATLLDENGETVATTPIAADGSYLFDGEDGVAPEKVYSVVLSTEKNATTAALPENWNNTGENINSAGDGNDGDDDGVISVSTSGLDVDHTEVPQVDFGINKKPVATDVTDPVVQNPGKDTQVEAPELNVTDNEDGTPTTITIETLPDAATGVLYYNGTAVTAGQVIPHFDQSKLTIDPTDGDQTVTFTYSTTDADGVKSDPATAEASFIDPILSGKVHNDGNGNGNVDSDAISAPDGTQLYATLLDENGAVLATQAIKADGTYSFNATDGVSFDKTFSVVIADKENVTETSLPTNWNNTGEQPANTESNGNDGDKNGKLEVSFGPITGDKEMPNNDFGINKKPVAEDNSVAAQMNPGGDTKVPVADLKITDKEDGTPTTVTIKTLPTNGTLYYNGVPVTAGQVIPNFDQSKLLVDPIEGTVKVIFDYTTTDADGIESDPATITMPFVGIKISGNIYHDGNGDGNVAGTPINKPEGTPLYVTLIDSKGKVVATKPVNDDGSYLFEGEDGTRSNTDYRIILSISPNAKFAQLPEHWTNSGENLNNNGKGNDGSANGIISVRTKTVDVPKIDFGINKAPEAVDQTEPPQVNKPGNWRLPVPDLAYTDKEDGIPVIVTIVKLPTNGTLYYDGKLVAKGQRIPHFDNSKLTVDPYDGDQTIVFKYTTTDAEGAVSDEATVTMPLIIGTATPTPTPIPTPTATPTPTVLTSPSVRRLPLQSATTHPTAFPITTPPASTRR